MFEPIVRKFWDWRLHRMTRRKLSMLDDRLLADMGVERDKLDDFIAGRQV